MSISKRVCWYNGADDVFGCLLWLIYLHRCLEHREGADCSPEVSRSFFEGRLEGSPPDSVEPGKLPCKLLPCLLERLASVNNNKKKLYSNLCPLYGARGISVSLVFAAGLQSSPKMLVEFAAVPTFGGLSHFMSGKWGDWDWRAVCQHQLYGPISVITLPASLLL